MASFGEELRRERELRDISLKEIAEATKISIKFLEALEQNHFDVLPGGIFNRGFIRAYARFIGVDGEEMVNAYLREVSQRQPRQGHTGQTEALGPAGVPPQAEAIVPAGAPASLRPEAHRPPREVPNERRVSPRQDIRLERRLTPRAKSTPVEGRTSTALWGIAGLAFLVGAAVLTMSLMDNGGTEPSAVKTQAPQADTPAQPSAKPSLVAGVTDGIQAAPGPLEQAEGAATTPHTDGQPAQGSEIQVDPNGQPAVPAEPVIPERQVRIVAIETTRIRVECADKLSLDQELWPGQSKTIACREPVLLSADNAGAVQYSLDDSPARLLGGVGEKVEGLVVAPTAPPPAQRRPAPAGPSGGQGVPNAGD